MKEVFISHNTSDKEVANRIVDYLEKSNISCFIAPRDIESGSSYASQLTKALKECLLVLLIASERSNKSEHVLNEIDIISDNNIPLLPIFIEEHELNDDLRYYIGRKQRIMATENDITYYLPTILSAVEERLPKKQIASPTVTEEERELPQHTKKVFEYIPERGIMINPEDRQRNVSFRTDTLISLMGEIYEKFSNITQNKEVVEEIFFSSGYVSGKSFAERINNLWDMGNTLEDFQKKLDKWCEFDSAVGWGKFDAKISYDEESDVFTGKLTINEAFLVDKTQKRKVCAFIKGYCTGVIETLLDSTQVELVCIKCPIQSHFKSKCEFDILIKEG